MTTDAPDGQPTRRGNGITLRPLRADDLAALHAAASDPAIWVQHPEPDRHEPAPFARFFAGARVSLVPGSPAQRRTEHQAQVSAARQKRLHHSRCCRQCSTRQGHQS